MAKKKEMTEEEIALLRFCSTGEGLIIHRPKKSKKKTNKSKQENSDTNTDNN